MLTPSLSPGLLCSWVTGQRQWVSLSFFNKFIWTKNIFLSCFQKHQTEGQAMEPRKVYWGPWNERSGSCLKNPKLPESSHQNSFLGKWKRDMVSYKHLGVRALFWGSGQGQVTVPINISWVLVSVLTRKGRSWGRTYPPGSSPGWVRAQLAVPSGLGPETLLSRQCWGSRAPNPTGPQDPKVGHVVGGMGAGPPDGIPGRRGCQKVAEKGRESLPPQGLGPASRGHSKGSGGQQDTAPNMSPAPPEHPLACGWMNWSTFGGRLGLTLTSLTTWQSLLQWTWLNVLTNGHSLVVASLEEEPIANGWTGPVAWWQGAA